MTRTPEGLIRAARWAVAAKRRPPARWQAEADARLIEQLADALEDLLLRVTVDLVAENRELRRQLANRGTTT